MANEQNKHSQAFKKKEDDSAYSVLNREATVNKFDPQNTSVPGNEWSEKLQKNLTNPISETLVSRDNKPQSGTSQQSQAKTVDMQSKVTNENDKIKSYSDKDAAINEDTISATKQEATFENKARGRKKKDEDQGAATDNNNEKHGNNDDIMKGNNDEESHDRENKGETSVNILSNDDKSSEKRSRGRPKKEKSGNADKEDSAKVRGIPNNDDTASTREIAADSTEKRGRGRPKKGESVNTDNDSGLSKQADTNVSEVTQQRSRGRPKKTNSDQKTVIFNNSEKRGRGRPKKSGVANIVTTNNSGIPSEKRGRGRPRNTDVGDNVKAKRAGKTTATGSSEKRGRGRPRKNPLMSQIGKSNDSPKPVDKSKVSNGTAKTRGRPRKLAAEKEGDDNKDLSNAEAINESQVEQSIQISSSTPIADTQGSVSNGQEPAPMDADNVTGLGNSEVKPLESSIIDNLDYEVNVLEDSAKNSNGESLKKRGRPKKNDQTEQELAKKVKSNN